MTFTCTRACRRAEVTTWQKTDAPEQDYAKAAAQEAIKMRDEIVSAIGKITL